MRNLPSMQVQHIYIPFNGGMDVVSPQMSVNPGTLQDAQNIYQDINSGYWTGAGYERFDGRTSPSAARYSVLECTITGSVSVNDVLTDNTAAAYGTVIALTSTSAILTKVTGNFATGNIKVGAAVVGTCVGPQVADAAQTVELDAQYKNLAADVYRADIGAVPGSGPIRGVVYHNDDLHAFRDNVGATACDIYCHSTSGWDKVDLGHYISFNSGSDEPAEGTTITGAVSGDTAVVLRVLTTAGDWGAGTAEGEIHYVTHTGTFQAENLNFPSSANFATCLGAATAVTILPGGKYQFIIANFTGESGGDKIYGCDGVNPGFEFDGTLYMPINTGMTTDTPDHVAEYQYRLVFSFGAAVQFSEIANPYSWSILSGSAIIAVGDDITGLKSQQGTQDTGSLVIFTRNTINVLYNNGSGTISDWNLVNYKKNTGCIEWTDQIIGSTLFLDDRGILELKAAQEFGNFQDSAQSNQILTWLQPKKGLVTDSCVIKEKNLYCIFFSDKTAIFATVMGGQVAALIPQTFSHKVERIYVSEDSSGNEVVFFGDDDGYVYQYDKGTSFDGEEISWWAEFAYNHFNSPYRVKRYRRAIFEIAGNGFAQFYFSYSLGYRSTFIHQPAEQQFDTNLKRTQWDNFTWDAFVWDGTSLAPTDIPMVGSGENMSIKLRGNSDYYDQIRFSGALIQFSETRRKR